MEETSILLATTGEVNQEPWVRPVPWSAAEERKLEKMTASCEMSRTAANRVSNQSSDG
jgi:hypothetical protein